MSETIISWASHTWNPFLWRCNLVSRECKNCYAKTMAGRYGQTFDLVQGQAMPTRWPNALKELAKFPAKSVLFVNSMSDTFHANASQADIHRIFNLAVQHPNKVFLVLTKRPERALALSPYLAWPDNLWLGTSVGVKASLWRLDYLTQLPTNNLFVSAEPLLEPLPELANYLPRVRWVIVGGESGKERRPFDKAWAREIRDLCQAKGTVFTFKQGSAYKSEQDKELDGKLYQDTPFNCSEFPKGSTPAESAVAPRKFTVGQQAHITFSSGKVVCGIISSYASTGFYGMYADGILFPVPEDLMTPCNCVHDAPVTVPTQDAPKPQNKAVLPQKWQRVERMSDLAKGQEVMTYAGKGTLKHFVNEGWWWVELKSGKLDTFRWEYLSIEAVVA